MRVLASVLLPLAVLVPGICYAGVVDMPSQTAIISPAMVGQVEFAEHISALPDSDVLARPRLAKDRIDIRLARMFAARGKCGAATTAQATAKPRLEYQRQYQHRFGFCLSVMAIVILFFQVLATNKCASRGWLA